MYLHKPKGGEWGKKWLNTGKKEVEWGRLARHYSPIIRQSGLVTVSIRGAHTCQHRHEAPRVNWNVGETLSRPLNGESESEISLWKGILNHGTLSSASGLFKTHTGRGAEKYIPITVNSTPMGMGITQAEPEPSFCVERGTFSAASFPLIWGCCVIFDHTKYYRWKSTLFKSPTCFQLSIKSFLSVKSNCSGLRSPANCSRVPVQDFQRGTTANSVTEGPNSARRLHPQLEALGIHF